MISNIVFVRTIFGEHKNNNCYCVIDKNKIYYKVSIIGGQKMIRRKFYLDKIKPFINKPVVKVIVGMRRVGKSTFLQLLKEQLIAENIAPDNILIINMESLEYDFIKDYRSLYRFVKEKWKGVSGQKYLFIDEIQEIQSWEKAVNSLLSESIADLYISGSNAHLFSSELATLLSGRYVEFRIYPLTFSEFLTFRNEKISKIDKETEFNNYLKYGGLPGIHFLDFLDEVVYQYIQSIFNTILFKDIVRRHVIRNTALLEKLTRFLFDNCGNIFSARRIVQYLKSQGLAISTGTILNYLAHLQESFLISKASRYDIKGKRQLEIYEKYYLGDIGIRHGFIGYREADISQLLENIVYLELCKRGYKVSVGKFNGNEIDFIAEKDNQREYFQVCYLLASEATRKREFDPLEKINDNYPKKVLSLDRFGNMDRNGINHEYLIDFLLSDEN